MGIRYNRLLICYTVGLASMYEDSSTFTQTQSHFLIQLLAYDFIKRLLSLSGRSSVVIMFECIHSDTEANPFCHGSSGRICFAHYGLCTCD
jgi:hypothetical protein